MEQLPLTPSVTYDQVARTNAEAEAAVLRERVRQLQMQMHANALLQADAEDEAAGYRRLTRELLAVVKELAPEHPLTQQPNRQKIFDVAIDEARERRAKAEAEAEAAEKAGQRGWLGRFLFGNE